jgi:ATP-dependent Clp protease adaptor protein ClpS
VPHQGKIRRRSGIRFEVQIFFVGLSCGMAKEDSIIQEKIAVSDREALQEPPLYKVLLHNDDYTTMEFVVMILQTVFRKNTDEATRIMLNVHNQGVGIAGVYTWEVGETKVAIVHRMAKKNQFPLRCSLEKDC